MAALNSSSPLQRSRVRCAFVVPTPWSCVDSEHVSTTEATKADERVLSFDTKTRHVRITTAGGDATPHSFCDVLPASLRERWIGGPVWEAPSTDEPPLRKLLLRPSHLGCAETRAREGVATSVAALASSEPFLDQAALAVASGLDTVLYVEGAQLSHSNLLGVSDNDQEAPPVYPGYKTTFIPPEQTVVNQSAFTVQPVPAEAPEERPYTGGYPTVAITSGEFAVACLFAYMAEANVSNRTPSAAEEGGGNKRMDAHPTLMTHIAAAAATQGGRRLGDVASLGLLPIAVGRIMASLTLPNVSAGQWSPVASSSYSIQLSFQVIQQGQLLSLVRRDGDGSAVMDRTATSQKFEYVSDVENVQVPLQPIAMTTTTGELPPVSAPTKTDPITPYQSVNELVLAEPEASWITVRSVKDVADLCKIARAARRCESKMFGKVHAHHVIVVQCRVRRFVLPHDTQTPPSSPGRASLMSSVLTFVSGAAVARAMPSSDAASQPLRHLQNTLRNRTSLNIEPSFVRSVDQSMLTKVLSRALTGRALLFAAVLAEATEPGMTIDSLAVSTRNVSMLGHPPWKQDRASPRVYDVALMLLRVAKAEYLARVELNELECRCWEMLLKDGNKTCACKAVMLF